MAKNKRTLSKDDKDFIAQNKEEMTPEQMSEKIGVAKASITQFINVYEQAPKQNSEWKDYLRRTTVWKQVRDVFTSKELDYFEEQYIKLMTQFDGDLFSSEETQLFNMIKLQILMTRNLEAKRRARDQIDKLEQVQKGIIDKYGGDFSKMTSQDSDAIASLGSQISTFSSAEQNATSEYLQISKEQQAINKELKASRAQRLDTATNAKVSFSGLVKMLMDRDTNEKEGRHLDLFKKATEKEKNRLSSPHKYIDGSVDLPILSDESVEMLEQQELAEEKEEENATE